MATRWQADCERLRSERRKQGACLVVPCDQTSDHYTAARVFATFPAMHRAGYMDSPYIVALGRITPGRRYRYDVTAGGTRDLM